VSAMDFEADEVGERMWMMWKGDEEVNLILTSLPPGNGTSKLHAEL
jgi:hypothetical protein